MSSSSSSSGAPRRAATSRRAHPIGANASPQDPAASVIGGVPAPTPVTRDASHDLPLNGGVSELERTLITLNAAIGELERSQVAVEQLEQRREKTAVALRLEVVSCKWAAVAWDRDRTFPTFTFPTEPCFKGKTQPDQDCRTCVNCVLIPWGSQHMGAHETRYPYHGVVFPIADEEQATLVAQGLASQGITHLRRVAHELHAFRRAATTAQTNLTRARTEEAQTARTQPQRAARRRATPRVTIREEPLSDTSFVTADGTVRDATVDDVTDS